MNTMMNNSTKYKLGAERLALDEYARRAIRYNVPIFVGKSYCLQSFPHSLDCGVCTTCPHRGTFTDEDIEVLARKFGKLLKINY